MITAAQIENFQRHEFLLLEFDRVTTIVGDNERGKSAVLRAIWWALTNQPRGDSMLRHGADDRYVTITIDGSELTRGKGKAGNTYDIDGTELRAFGSGVPSDVDELVRVMPDNYASQFDGVFWADETPGQLAKSINMVAGLDPLDEMLAKSARADRKAKQTLAIRRDDYETAYDAATAVDDVDEMIGPAAELQAMADRLSELHTGRDRLKELVAEVETHATAARSGADIGQKWARVKECRDRLVALTAQRNRLTELCDTARQGGRLVKQTKAELLTAKAALAEVEICPTCKRPL